MPLKRAKDSCNALCWAMDILFPVAATVIYCFATMPEYGVSFRKAFNRGRKAVAICHWNWVEILSQPTQELKNRINQNIIE